ncbi:MAG: hypothetical protein AAGC55_12710 [Myxococcota bacterium]
MDGFPDDGSSSGDGPNDPSNPGTPNDPAPLPPEYTLSVTSEQVAALTLGNTASFELTLLSERFAGPVTLTVPDLPSSWEVEFLPSDFVDVPLDGTVTVTMNVVVATSAEAKTTDLIVRASAEPGEREAVVNLAVENRLIIDIEDGVGEGTHTFPSLAEIRLGATVELRNSDSTSNHRIHAGDGDVGFEHQPDNMGAGESYVVNITATGRFNYYCHIHEVGAGVGQLRVIEPPAEGLTPEKLALAE